MTLGSRSAAVVATAIAVLALVIAPAVAKQSATTAGGTWSGTWKRTSAPPTQGTMTLVLKQKGTSLSGSEKVQGSACLTTNDVTGSMKGSSISWAVSEANITAKYKGTVSGSKLSGSLDVKCGGVEGTGTFSLKRK